MSRRIRCFFVLICTLLLLPLGTACEAISDDTSSGDGAGYLFTISLASNPKSLDPQSAVDDASKTIITNLYEGLVEQNSDGSIVTAAAESIDISDDGLTYTFTLHDDRYWYYDANQDDIVDEDEVWSVTAADYVYAFQRIFDPETQSPYREMFSCLKNASAIIEGSCNYTEIGVHALSANVVAFTLEYPCAQFLTLLTSTAAMPCNEDFFLSTKGRYGLDQESVASCGAFYLRLWFYDPWGNDNLIYMRRLSANTAGRSVYPSNLTFQIRDSREEVEEDFANGTSDVLITSTYSKSYVNDDDYNCTAQAASTLGLIFNPEIDVFQNDNIRKGLSLGIDRAILGEDSDDDLTPASKIVPPATYLSGVCYRETVPDILPTYDADEAVKIFQTGLDELGIYAIDSAKILCCSTLCDCEYLHIIIQTWQELFGFYIGIDEVTEKEYWERLESGDYTIALYEITGFQNSPAAVLSLFSSDVNTFGYENTSVDNQIERLWRCASESEILSICQNLESFILNDSWFVPLFYKNQYTITTSNNDDILHNPFTGATNYRRAKHYT